MQSKLNILLYKLNYKEFYHLEYNPVQSVKSQVTFRRNFRLHLQGGRLSQEINQQHAVNKQALQILLR